MHEKWPKFHGKSGIFIALLCYPIQTISCYVRKGAFLGAWWLKFGQPFSLPPCGHALPNFFEVEVQFLVKKELCIKGEQPIGLYIILGDISVEHVRQKFTSSLIDRNTPVIEPVKDIMFQLVAGNHRLLAREVPRNRNRCKGGYYGGNRPRKVF